MKLHQAHLVFLLWVCVSVVGGAATGNEVSEEPNPGHQQHSPAEERENTIDKTEEDTGGAAVALSQNVGQPDVQTVLREMTGLLARLTTEVEHSRAQVNELEQRMEQVKELEIRVSELQQKQEQQTGALGQMGDTVSLTVSQVEDLRRDRQQRKVAFSTALVSTGHLAIGPAANQPTIIFNHIYLNTGNAYNPNTGIFMAPVKGVYQFLFFIYGGGHKTYSTGAILFKNRERITMAYMHQPTYNVKPSNGVSLLLEVGDVVYLKLETNARILDNMNHHTTFSGHLLFRV